MQDWLKQKSRSSSIISIQMTGRPSARSIQLLYECNVRQLGCFVSVAYPKWYRDELDMGVGVSFCNSRMPWDADGIRCCWTFYTWGNERSIIAHAQPMLRQKKLPHLKWKFFVRIDTTLWLYENIFRVQNVYKYISWIHLCHSTLLRIFEYFAFS